MKKTIRQRLRDWLMDNEYAPVEAITSTRSIKTSNNIDSDKGIRFQVYKASGGTVIETNFYNRHRDQSYNGLYVITDDKDLGFEIGKIITVEAMKQ